MKKIIIVMAAVFLFFSGCASIQSGMNYTALAKEQSFDYFFPGPAGNGYFTNLDEAYDYVNTARTKFTISSGKTRAKGLAAKLIGPPVAGETQKPVTVYYMMGALSEKNNKIEVIDLSTIDKPLEMVIREALSATLVFLIFYEDRGTSWSNFHLKSGYQYTSNSQINSFPYAGNEYEANYPIGWSVDKAFSYLRKEID